MVRICAVDFDRNKDASIDDNLEGHRDDWTHVILQGNL